LAPRSTNTESPVDTGLHAKGWPREEAIWGKPLFDFFPIRPMFNQRWVMKTFVLSLVWIGLGMATQAGETNQLQLHSSPVPASPATSAALASSTNSAPRLFRKERAYGGVLPDLKRKKAQFFRADPQYPNREFQNVSINPVTGRAEGIVLFSVAF
jgi:hypothetical protein